MNRPAPRPGARTLTGTDPTTLQQSSWADNPSARRPGVLVVDCDCLVLEFVQKALPPCGFRVWAAPGCDEALGLVCRHEGDLNAAVLEARMPGCSGPALLAQLRRTKPDLPAVFVSLPWGLGLDGLDEAPLLPKPFKIADLARLLRQEMERKGHRHGGG